jgi:hypothetical protein
MQSASLIVESSTFTNLYFAIELNAPAHITRGVFARNNVAILGRESSSITCDYSNFTNNVYGIQAFPSNASVNNSFFIANDLAIQAGSGYLSLFLFEPKIT